MRLFFSQQAWNQLETANRHAVSSGVGYDFDLPAHREDGSPLWIQATGEAQFNASNEAIALRGTMLDISRWKGKVEKTDYLDGNSSQENSKRAAVFESPVIGFVICDPMGGSLLMNSTAEGYFGGSAENPTGWAIHFGDGRPRPASDWPLARALRGEFLQDLEVYWKNLDSGKESAFNWSTAPVYAPDGNLRFILQTVIPVVETKLDHKELTQRNSALERAKLSADQANQAKSDFLSRMSHELRSPLHTILGFAQLIDGDDPPPTLAQAASVEQILKAGWYLLALINEVLDLSQIESGNLVIAQERASLAEVLRECRAMVVPQGRKHGIRITFADSSGPFFVLADRTRLKQVLLNLLSNAIQYNQENGSILVNCALEPGTDGLNMIRVSISDTGQGIASERLPHLFQPFNRLDHERRESEGTGIGLVMSKRLVELMGGSIGVESNLGVGSTFWFELKPFPDPIQTEAVEPDSISNPSAGPPASPSGKTFQTTVLYVEDNPAARDLMEKLFLSRLPHYRLFCAGDGKQGIHFAQVLAPDVILMDIHLPDLNGVEVLRQLRGHSITAKIPVIALSANAMPQDIHLGLEAGFYRYLTKPTKMRALVEALEEAVEFASPSAI